MRKKISVQELRKGMYVAELDREWRETPFLFQGFVVLNDDDIKQLAAHCQHVYIEVEGETTTTQKPHATPVRTTVQAEPRADESRRIFTILEALKPGQALSQRYPDTTTLIEEMPRAREVVHQTRESVYSMMDDARLGRAVDTDSAKKVVAAMVESVIANPDALVCFNELKSRDEYTALHSLRVCVLALAFGRHLGLANDELNLLGIGALLHDLGKMRVPLDILNKPGKLTEQEFEIMKSHVPLGIDILERSHGILQPSIDVARLHHERFNGAGYASGLEGGAINLFGGVGAIVDCYDAITSDRVYHKGMSAHEALRTMYSWRGRDFQPHLIEQFIQCMGVYPIGSVVELSTGAVGVVVSINRRERLRPRVTVVLAPDKTPYPSVKIIDLMHQSRDEKKGGINIRRVLPAGSFGIVPKDYIPFPS